MLLEGRRDDARSDEAGDVSHVRHEESARLEGRETSRENPGKQEQRSLATPLMSDVRS